MADFDYMVQAGPFIEALAELGIIPPGISAVRIEADYNNVGVVEIWMKRAVKITDLDKLGDLSALVEKHQNG